MLYLTTLHILLDTNNGILNMNSLFPFCHLHTAHLQYQSSLGVRLSCHLGFDQLNGNKYNMCYLQINSQKPIPWDLHSFTFWMILWQIMKTLVQQDEMTAKPPPGGEHRCTRNTGFIDYAYNVHCFKPLKFGDMSDTANSIALNNTGVITSRKIGQ